MTTSKNKFPLAKCRSLAEKIKTLLVPVCEAVEIAGSIRREKPFCADIELVFCPKIVTEPDGLFDTKPVNLALRLIDFWLEGGIVEKRLAVTGKISSWSDLNRHAVHKGSGIPVDFFCEPDILDFPRSLVIRTGSKEFNVELMSTAPKVGIEPHAYGVAMKRLSDGERVIAKDEREFITLCGVKYVEPKDR